MPTKEEVNEIPLAVLWHQIVGFLYYNVEKCSGNPKERDEIERELVESSSGQSLLKRESSLKLSELVDAAYSAYYRFNSYLGSMSISELEALYGRYNEKIHSWSELEHQFRNAAINSVLGQKSYSELEKFRNLVKRRDELKLKRRELQEEAKSLADKASELSGMIKQIQSEIDQMPPEIKSRALPY